MEANLVMTSPAVSTSPGTRASINYSLWDGQEVDGIEVCIDELEDYYPPGNI